MSTARLQVMICTYGSAGLERVGQMPLPAVEGVAYLVSCQSDPLPLPMSLVRDDVRVVFTPTRGLSNNRNNALMHADADYGLVADDDVTFYPEGLRAIIAAFDSNPELDYATFRCDYPYQVTYPPSEHDMSRRYPGYITSSIEIAVRIDSIRRASLRFSPLLGLGAEHLHAAEEGMFLLSCQKHGLRGRFFPVTIASHPSVSTGMGAEPSKGAVRANGAYIICAHPLSAVLRIPLVAYRQPGSMWRNLYNLLWGAAYGIKHRREMLNL